MPCMLEGHPLLAWNVKPPALLGTWRSLSGWLCGSAFVMSGDWPCIQDNFGTGWKVQKIWKLCGDTHKTMMHFQFSIDTQRCHSSTTRVSSDAPSDR